MLPKRLQLKRSANGLRSQRVRAGKLGQNAVRWSAFIPLRPGTGRASALGQHALQEVVGILDICLGTAGAAEIVQAFQFPNTIHTTKPQARFTTTGCLYLLDNSLSLSSL